MGEADDFRSAGRTLFSLGLVKEAEGNLSTFDGGMLRITRTGARLDRLEDADVVTGGMEREVLSASTDLEVHRRLYRERGPGAVVHAHPTGTVPEGGGGPGDHGLYTFAASLQDAVAGTVGQARGLERAR